MSRAALLLAIAGCGRIAFDPLDDAGAGSGSSGGGDIPAGPCMSTTLDIPLASGFPIARIPYAWALVGEQPGILSMIIVRDDLTQLPPITFETVSSFIVHDAFWTGEALIVVWQENASTVTFRVSAYDLDGTRRWTVPIGTYGSGVWDGRALLVQQRSVAPIELVSVSADGHATAPYVVTTNTSTAMGRVASGGQTDAATWRVLPSPGFAHLAGATRSGSIVLADRSYGPSNSTPRLLWTGSSFTLLYAPTTGGLELVVLDAMLNERAPPAVPTAFLSFVTELAWNGVELGAVYQDLVVGMHDIAFVPSTTDGMPTGPIQYFGSGTASLLTGTVVAGGANRFALAWAADMQGKFAIACR